MADPTHTPRRASKETYELEEFEQQAGPSNYKKNEKPMKTCPFCSKTFKDLKRHVKVCKGKLFYSKFRLKYEFYFSVKKQ